MTAPHHEELLRAEDMMQSGDYSEAVEIVLSFLSREGLSDTDRFYGKLIESRLKIKLGNIDEAEKALDEALERARSPIHSADVLLIRLEIMWRTGRIDEGLVTMREGEELLSNIESDYDDEHADEKMRLKADLLRHSGILYWYKGEFDKAKGCHRQSLDFCQQRKDYSGVANSYNNLGLVYWSKGNLDEAAEYYEKALEVQNQLGNKQQIATVLNNLGNVYMLKGELEKGHNYHQSSLKIKEDLGNYRDLALSLANLGSVHEMRGDLNQALDCLFRSLEYFEEVNDKSGISLSLNNLGSVHLTRGDLDTSLEYHNKSLSIKREQNNKQEIALSLLNIGEIEQRKGNLHKAYDDYKESLSLYEESGNELYISISLFYLVNLSLDRNQLDMAQKYLERLGELNAETDNRVVDQRYRVSKALILKTSKKGRDKLRAQEILSEVVEEEISNHPLTVTAMIHLCDLLLFEMKITDDDELLDRVYEITQNLLEIGRDQGSFTLLTKTNILQSKLALIEGDVEKSRILLAQAHITSQEKGLYMLARKVAHERDSLQSQLEKWENIIKKNPSKQEMADLANLDEFLERMIRKTVSVLSIEEKKYIDDEAIRRKYNLEYVDLLEGSQKSEKSTFRIGIAQMGLSEDGDILNEFYKEVESGLLGIREEKTDYVRTKIKSMIKSAHEDGINVLVFPEMTIDMNYSDLVDEVTQLAKTFEMLIIPGSYHSKNTKQNLCRVISPDGVVWEQEKHIPAIIHIEGKRFTEGIDVGKYPRRIIVCNTEYGRIAIAICRDFLDMDLRVELKNFDPPIDLVINPAFTPVTADFKAAHFDARRSIYAYCFFANVAEFGNSIIHSPEKDRVERVIPKGEEGIVYKDVDLFQLRAERKKWENIQKKQRSFIQSTRL